MAALHHRAKFGNLALALGFVLVLFAACESGSGTQAQPSQSTPPSAYATTVKTSDGLLAIHLTVRNSNTSSVVAPPFS